jgi:hypothetical protein
MEILKLKTVDFTIESNEMKETDMIFSFNNEEIKMYLSYETGEVKEVIFKSGNENFEKKEYNNSDFLNLIGVPTLDYKYGLYEYVEIEVEEKLEKYLYNGNIIYILEGKEIFLRIEFDNKIILFDKNNCLIGFEKIVAS